MAGFPAGWTLNTTQNATGIAASITVPPAAGIVHVLDSLYAAIADFTGAAAAFGPTVTVTTDAGLVLTSIMMLPAAAYGRDSISFSGLEITSAPGGGIVVACSAGPGAGLWEEITIQGHDI